MLKLEISPPLLLSVALPADAPALNCAMPLVLLVI